MLKKSVSMVFMWAGFYYVLSLASILALNFLDIDSLGVESKWRFVEPTYLTFVYLLFSVIGFLLPYFILRICVRGNEEECHVKVGRADKLILSGSVRCLYAVVLMIFITVELFLIEGNYRTESSGAGKLIMGPLNVFISTMLLLFILENKIESTFRPSFLVVLGLGVLLLSVTGAGGFLVILGLGFIYLWNAEKFSLSTSLRFILLGLMTCLAMIFFLLTFKYNYQSGLVTVDLLTWVITWIAQRVLTVTGSSVFLIETFYNSAPGYGIDGAYDVFMQNASKLAGSDSTGSMYSSLGQYNFSIFYIGDNVKSFGVSSGLLGGMIFFMPWIPASFLSGSFLFCILFFISLTWTRYLCKLHILINIVVFLCFIRFFLLNPYAWFSIIDPGFIRYLIFIYAPPLVEFVSRISLSVRGKRNLVLLKRQYS